MVELVGVSRPNSGAGQCRWPKKGAELLLHVLNNAESNAGLEGLDVDSLVNEHIQVDKAPNLQSSRADAPTQALPAPPRGSH